jgi:pimeloyl-ACP methyl ester carboxylesterase
MEYSRPGGKMNDERATLSGVAADVPYVALPPAERRDAGEATPLIIAWHLNDPPRSAAAMASALPLAGVAAWRVYLDLPMHGRRQLPGGLDEFMQLAYQDAVMKAFEPQVTQAIVEFPAVLTDLRNRLHLTEGPIGLVGASVGALPAQLVIAERAAQVSAATLISPVIQLAEVVAANERRFNVSYPWSDESRAVAARFDFVARAPEIAARDPQPALLLITGAEDDPAFALQAQRLHAELRPRYDDPERLRRLSVPRMKHAIAIEPGIEPAPQTGEAQLVEAATTEWFRRYLG